jgi:hypothetical protein
VPDGGAMTRTGRVGVARQGRGARGSSVCVDSPSPVFLRARIFDSKKGRLEEDCKIGWLLACVDIVQGMEND